MSGETKTRKSARLSDVRHRLYIDIATATPEKTSAETPNQVIVPLDYPAPTFPIGGAVVNGQAAACYMLGKSGRRLPYFA